LKQHYRCFLIQRLVIVAALWRLNTTGATILAGAFFNQLQGSLPQLFYYFKSFFSNADASRIGIIDEDLRLREGSS